MKWELDIEVSTLEMIVIGVFMLLLLWLIQQVPYKKLRLIAKTLLRLKRGNSS